MSNECYTIGHHKWMVDTLILHSKELEEVDVPIAFIDKSYPPFIIEDFEDYTTHYKRVRKANLSYPIILSKMGCVMDGRHRIIKAMLQGKKTIKAVQFKEDPPHDYWVE